VESWLAAFDWRYAQAAVRVGRSSKDRFCPIADISDKWEDLGMRLSRVVISPILVTLLGVSACRPAPLLDQKRELSPEALGRQVITLTMVVPDGHSKRVDRWLLGTSGQYIEIILFPDGIVQERGRRTYWAKERLDPPHVEFTRSYQINPATKKQVLDLLARIAPDHDGESSARGCSLPMDGPGALINVGYRLKDKDRFFLLFPGCETTAGHDAREVARQAVRLLTGVRYINTTLFQDR